MAKRVIGLDIGTYSVKVAHLEARTGDVGYDVFLYKEIPLSKFINPDIAKTEEELQKEAILELKSLGHLEGSWITTGLPGSDAQIRSLSVPFNNRKKIEAVLPGLMDSHLPFAVENLLYSWLFTEEKDSQSHLLVSFTRKEVLQDFLGKMRLLEVDPRYLTLKSSALYDLLTQLISKSSLDDSLHCVVDIGHKSTGICIGDKKKMRFSRSVPKGGYHVTQSLSQKTGVTFEEAERAKIDAKELSDPLREAYYPIAREVRQTILAIESDSRQKLEQIFLVGGGSKTVGLAEFMTSLLKVPVVFVDRFSQFHLASASRVKSRPKAEAGLALSYAVLTDKASHREPRFNFRKDEFSFSGEFDFMRQRIKSIVAWVCVILFLVAISGSIRNFFLTGRLETLAALQRQLCQQITGSAMDGSVCLNTMDAEIGQLHIPKWSATDAYIELAKAIGTKVQVKLTNLDITSDQKLRMTMQSQAMNADQDVVDQMNASSCFHAVDKSGKKQIPSGIQFIIKADFDCEKAKQTAQSSAPAAKPLEK